MTTQGYYQHPTIYNDNVVFVCEDDLWTVPASGGVARRLTANLGPVRYPTLSPDGQWLAFVGREEGHWEVYVMPAIGGPATRLTYLGATTFVVGWRPDSQQIIFSSNSGQPFYNLTPLFAISREGGYPESLPYGPARSISFAPKKGVVIGRRAIDLAEWKRYRGGEAGDIWIDRSGRGKFKPLLKKLNGNMATPMWFKQRIYFLSDHEGIGNLYSCNLAGQDIQRHTHHTDYYVRHPKTDGQRIIYQAGADLYVFEPTNSDSDETASSKVDIQFHSPRIERNRKFVKTSRYLEHYAIHPDGHSFALTARGKPFTMSNWEGAVMQYGQAHGGRYRLIEWLNDGQRLIMVSDSSGEEMLEIYMATDNQRLARLENADLGRPLFLEIAPHKDALVLGNHRYELFYVDDQQGVKLLDRSNYDRITCANWSPDGQWVVYDFSTSPRTSAIKLCHVETGETYFVTPPNNLYDYRPSFDPEGKYIYFLSRRDFEPVRDHHYFDWSFMSGTRPYLVTLRQDLPNPFIPLPDHLPSETSPKENGNPPPSTDADKPKDDSSEAAPEKSNEKQNLLQIDLEGIQNRVIVFPVSEGQYGQIEGIRKNKVLYSSFPVEGQNKTTTRGGRGTLEIYDFTERKSEVVVSGVSNFKLSRKKESIIYRTGQDLRIIKAGEKPDNSSPAFNKKSGWLMVNRAKVAINPPAEWQQMLREAWRLQRDHFWTEDMSQVDWQQIYERYQALIDRIASRYEFADLINEMQGELGTSHTFAFGGDYRYIPGYAQGFLGADFVYEPALEGYRITHIVSGDPWLEKRDSPLNRLGMNIKVGDVLLSIDGQRLSDMVSPQQLLVNQADMEIQLLLATSDENHNAANEDNNAPDDESAADDRPDNDNPDDDSADTPPPVADLPKRRVLVKTLRYERPVRYREWVDTNRRYVHDSTAGRVGYLHIPNMKASGYAEFHRYYLAEAERQGVIIDVRFNSGGNVSQLLLAKLAQRRIGYKQPRHGEAWPYPTYSVLGPMVALANEYTASDGDIFSHAFKLLKLGKLIGKRTWGGVVGYWPRNSLVDGTRTSQPEVFNWFEDVGWGVENYGTDPHIEVEIKPQDYAAGKDPQLERAIKEILKIMEKKPPRIPDFGPTPNRALPRLPDIESDKEADEE